MIPAVVGNSAGGAVTGQPDGAARLLAGLDSEQRAAVTAPAGPVCILAGAGTGKTRAITHRIAYRALTGEVAARQVLAVTFTARAAAELRARLAALGVAGVQARTFHAAALRQVRYFAPRIFAGRSVPELVDSKARLVTQAAGQVGLHADRTTARDLAGEIEWAKSSLVEPADYPIAAAKATRETPVDAARVAAVFSAYEQLKRAAGVIDFEDVLRAACWAIEEHPDVAEQVRAQYRHFTVDEYQDVNPLQQRLLDAWLGGRRDVTVVGDASQTIYSFTGASADYLIGFPRRHRDAVVIRLVRDYRSTPQVVGLANAVIRQARGSEARLRLELVGQRPAGPAPDVRACPDEPAEAEAVARRCAELIASGTPASQIAVLFRTNAQSEVYEEALARAEVPYVVHGAERFFERAEIRQGMVALRVATRSADPAHAAGRVGDGGVGGDRLATGPTAARWRRPGTLVRAGCPGRAGRRGGRHADRLRRGAVPPGRRPARPGRRGGDALLAARREGPGVGRRLPGRAGRGHPAHGVREDPGRAGGGAAAALRGDHPGPGVALAVVRGCPYPRWSAAPAEPVPATGPGHPWPARRYPRLDATAGTPGTRLVVGRWWLPAGSAAARCWPVRTGKWGGAPTARRISTRSCTSGCWTGGPG